MQAGTCRLQRLGPKSSRRLTRCTCAIPFSNCGWTTTPVTTPVSRSAADGTTTLDTATGGAGGNLKIAPVGDVIFDPVGDDILPQTGYDLNIGSLQRKYLTLHAAELWVETLVAQNTIATIGGRVLVGPTTVLEADLSSLSGTITVKHNEMTSGDIVYMEADAKVEFMAITSAASGTGPYTYSVTRNLDGTGANFWYAGDAVFNTGQVGDGFIDLYSVNAINGSGVKYGPTIAGKRAQFLDVQRLVGALGGRQPRRLVRVWHDGLRCRFRPICGRFAVGVCGRGERLPHHAGYDAGTAWQVGY